MKDIKVRNLIIGGGISGLTLAYFLKDSSYLVLEKETDVGGYCKTIKNPNYIWDYAGHFYHFKTEEFKKFFLSLVEPDEIITQTKNTKIFYKNKLIDFPFQMNIHQLQKKEFIECLYDLYYKKEKTTYDNFLDMLYGKYGKSIVHKFLKPYNEKLYATNLKKLDENAMGRFFPHANLDAIIRNMKESQVSTYNDNFLYLKKGTQYFIDKIYNLLNKEYIKLNTTAVKVDRHNKYVTTNTGDKIHYKNLINTIPLNRFFGLMDSYQGLIEEMSYNKVLVLNIGFDTPSKRFNKEHWVYFPDKNINFYRIGFYNNILKSEKLSVYVEIGYPKKDTKIDIQRELVSSIDNMNKVGIVDDTNKLVDYSAVLMDPAYVHISETTEKKIRSEITKLNRDHIFTLGRYGKWTYSSMEDCMVWAKELVSQIPKD